MLSVLANRGLDQLSPPEVEHVLLELPANRQEYVGLVADMAGWPDRMSLARRIPSDDEVGDLNKGARWRAITLLDDEPAQHLAAAYFQRLYVLDPLYDPGELLYAAWHDPLIKAQHARRLAEHASLVVHLMPLLLGHVAVLAPEHLPGSWDPRPGWRRPKPDADASQHEGWALRQALILIHWADRLDAVVCSSQPAVVAALDTAINAPARWAARLCAPSEFSEILTFRQKNAALHDHWRSARRLCRGRVRTNLAELACLLERIGEVPATDGWALVRGIPSLPDPALLLRRVLSGTDARREPALPLTRLKRAPLCLVLAEPSAE